MGVEEIGIVGEEDPDAPLVDVEVSSTESEDDADAPPLGVVEKLAVFEEDPDAPPSIGEEPNAVLKGSDADIVGWRPDVGDKEEADPGFVGWRLDSLAVDMSEKGAEVAKVLDDCEALIADCVEISDIALTPPIAKEVVLSEEL